MTAADRPSVTDDARAERPLRCDGTPHPEGAIPPLSEHDYRWDGDDPYVVCARCGERRDALTASRVLDYHRRAETTTATTEDAETAIWHDLLDTWGTSASGRRTMSPATARGITRHVIDALNKRGLLATGRTRPTREQIARAIDDEDTTPCAVCDDDWCYYCRADALRMADAVLALLDGQPETTTGKCPSCGYRYPLRKDGSLISHQIAYNTPCSGSGVEPEVSEEPAARAETTTATTDDRASAMTEAVVRADIAAAIRARRTGIRKPTGYDEGWDDALDIAEQIALGELT